MPEMVAAPLSNGDAGPLRTNGDTLNNNIKGVSSDANGDVVNNNDPLARAVASGGSDWIDADLVGEAFGEDPASVSDVQVKGAVAAGDNYCSCMWRVSARAGDRPLSLIVKAPPKGELMQHFVSQLGFFSKETKMLAETLPAMRAIGAARCGPDHILAQQLGPTALPSAVPGVLIMNDLSVDGFRNKGRQGQLDMRHCEVALEILARYHALSIALHREDPSSMDDYAEALFVRKPDAVEEEHARLHSEMQLIKFGEQLETWDGTKGKGLGEKMLRLSKYIYNQMCTIVAPNPSGINVLNHGDFWINNMMYKYDDDDDESLRPRDIRLVDLQLVRFSSPCLDLQYFITSSAQQEVREGELDTLLQCYRDHYNEYVSALGLEDARWPSLGALREEYLSKSLFGFSAMYTVLCAVVAQPEDRLQLENITKDNMHEADISSRAWRGRAFQRLLPGLLDYYVDVGVLK